MGQQEPTIYLVETIPDEDGDQRKWRIRRWEEPLALIPLFLVEYVVSTAAGDVKLYMPYLASRDRDVLMWAYAEIKRLHPKPTDLESLDMLSQAERFQLTLHFALEYIQLAEDGRGHNDRSHYLARCLRKIDCITTNPVCPAAGPNSGAPANFDFRGE